jgi:hypothetical protein
LAIEFPHDVHAANCGFRHPCERRHFLCPYLPYSAVKLALFCNLSRAGFFSYYFVVKELISIILFSKLALFFKKR